MVQVRAPHGFSSAVREQLEGLVREHDPQAAVRYLEAVYPVAAGNKSLFDNMADTLIYCAEHGVFSVKPPSATNNTSRVAAAKRWKPTH